eukprot:UN11420
MKIHYVGYPSKFDEWIKVDSDRIKSTPQKRRTSTSSSSTRLVRKSKERTSSRSDLNNRNNTIHGRTQST